MESFQIGQAAKLLGVSPDTVRRWVDSGKLPATKLQGRRQIKADALASFAQAMATGTEPGSLSTTSARNRLIGLVTNVVKDGVMAQVELVCGPYRVVSLISREAADELALAPGTLAVASVKATNVVLELPPS
jgi:molybdopterin-binding protein